MGRPVYGPPTPQTKIVKYLKVDLCSRMNLSQDGRDGMKVVGFSEGLFKVLGQPGTVELLLYISDTPRRYRDLEKSKILPNTTLKRRLRSLNNLGMVKKVQVTSKKREIGQYVSTIPSDELLTFASKYERVRSNNIAKKAMKDLEEGGMEIETPKIDV